MGFVIVHTPLTGNNRGGSSDIAVYPRLSIRENFFPRKSQFSPPAPPPPSPPFSIVVPGKEKKYRITKQYRITIYTFLWYNFNVNFRLIIGHWKEFNSIYLVRTMPRSSDRVVKN